MLFFFFFKQKTAYEMRISDWSSDVCSSDLRARARCRGNLRRQAMASPRPCCNPGVIAVTCSALFSAAAALFTVSKNSAIAPNPSHPAIASSPVIYRSEEHTSDPVTNAPLVCRILLEKKNTTNKYKQNY